MNGRGSRTTIGYLYIDEGEMFCMISLYLEIPTSVRLCQGTHRFCVTGSAGCATDVDVRHTLSYRPYR